MNQNVKYFTSAERDTLVLTPIAAVALERALNKAMKVKTRLPLEFPVEFMNVGMESQPLMIKIVNFYSPLEP